MMLIQIFVYLQVLDFLTTLVGFRLGASEASPFIAKLIHASSPAVGVLASKGLAFALGGVLVATHRMKMLVWANYWYAALIVWNLSTMLSTHVTIVVHAAGH